MHLLLHHARVGQILLVAPLLLLLLVVVVRVSPVRFERVAQRRRPGRHLPPQRVLRGVAHRERVRLHRAQRLRQLRVFDVVRGDRRARGALQRAPDQTLQHVPEHPGVSLGSVRRAPRLLDNPEVRRQRLQLVTSPRDRILRQGFPRQRKRVHEPPILRKLAAESSVLRLEKPGVELTRVVRGEEHARAPAAPPRLVDVLLK
mmetsp:Transcript_4334/g.19632  ORF Transcript_4334/g.19632 Transcript_4334/m.19632 type:complete len:202 (-) Transcript_4334:1113-1718(-)